MATYSFGVGRVYVQNPAISGDTPIELAVVQNVSLEIQSQVQQLFGNRQFPVAIGTGQSSVSGTVAAAKFNSAAFAKFMFAATVNSGHTAVADEDRLIPAAPGPYTVVVVRNSDYTENLGVVEIATGKALRRVASVLTAGQYSVNEATGTYTFAAADQGKAIQIRYKYVSVNGSNYNVKNQLMGTQTPFKMDLYNTFQGKFVSTTLHSCVFTGLSEAFTNDNFNVPNLTFQAFANDADLLMSRSFGEIVD